DSDSEIAFCHTATEFFTSEGVIVATTGAFQRSYVRPGAELVESFLRGKRVVNSSSMFRRSLFEAVGGWSSDYRNCMDIDLWYRLMLHRKVGYIGSILVGFRSHSITDGWTTLLVDEHIDWLRNAFALLPPSLRHLREIEEDVIAMYSARGARALGHLPATEERVRVISKLQAQPGSEGVRSTLDHWYQRAMQAVRPRATVLAAKLPERARHTIGDLARMRFPFR
ncbi:MAG: hypothetical protein JWN04_757, partial [Myxococcaceae bacterium]|nr:hypothetical protein [Myxococcaceae bacterium]